MTWWQVASCIVGYVVAGALVVGLVRGLKQVAGDDVDHWSSNWRWDEPLIYFALLAWPVTTLFLFAVLVSRFAEGLPLMAQERREAKEREDREKDEQYRRWLESEEFPGVTVDTSGRRGRK